MPEKSCPVSAAIAELDDLLQSNRLDKPKIRRIVEEMRLLLNDIAWGRAGGDHLPAMESLVQEIGDISSDAVVDHVKTFVESILQDHPETIRSHIESHNCPSGECVKLAPAPCQMTCPAGIDIPTYVTLIGQGKDAEAIDVIRKDNPFPWVCGLVCTRPCELMCIRGRIDKPVSIKFLKAFAAERAFSHREYRNPPKKPENGHKVCVIGAGPGGMTAAYYLALNGYQVRVIEALPMAGGMMMVGIPRYRLPREVIDREVAMIEDLGVEFVFNTRFGRDLTMAQLKAEGFEAFLFAIGAHTSFKLRIPGETDYPQVIDAIEFLRNVALGDRHMPGKKIIIIGGGNVAIDAARTSLRLGCEEVTIAYRRARTEMPADEEEVEQAEEEGIHFSFLTIPVEVVGKEGSVTALKCLRAELVQREGSSRKSPVPVMGSDHFMEADAVICAIGQQVDHQWLSELSELKWTRRNTIDVDMSSMATNIEGVFAIGDAVTGPATVIEAIGGGKKAAEAVDRFFNGIPQRTMPPVPVRRARVDWLEVPASTKMVLKRPEMELLNIDRRRIMFQQVELGYSENQVREEARRCLRCDICRRCGDCVKVCRDQMKIDALQMGYLDFDHPVKTDFRLTEVKCIACGACAENCSNNAMQIIDRDNERILSLCGTILNRQKLVYCENCGTVIGPAKYLDFIKKRFDKAGQVDADHAVCEACARKRVVPFDTESVPVKR
ncbi:MAG: FAD-dependent oxidoreductase [Desulfobacteraceae bacterium]|nr:FAD-dependent oxidoreductase [Desulfobacteraceae bacterium]